MGRCGQPVLGRYGFGAAMSKTSVRILARTLGRSRCPFRRAGRCRRGRKCGNKCLRQDGQEHLYQCGQKCLDQCGQKYLDQNGQRYSGRYGQRNFDEYGQKYLGQCGRNGLPPICWTLS
jgi:hypothetical protein